MGVNINHFVTPSQKLKKELSDPTLAFFKSLQDKITSNDDPTNEFSLSGKTGTVIIFDELGIHSGGCVSVGTRNIFRIGFQSEDIFWRDKGIIRSFPRSILSRLLFTKLHSIF